MLLFFDKKVWDKIYQFPYFLCKSLPLHMLLSLHNMMSRKESFRLGEQQLAAQVQVRDFLFKILRLKKS